MSTISVLLLDDHPEAHQLIRLGLERAEQTFDITNAYTTDEARALVHSRRFDIIIADYLLAPEASSGSDFLLGLLQKGYAIPLILASDQTSASFDAHTRFAINEGNITFIDKNHILSGRLAECVTYLLGRRLSVLCLDDDPDDFVLIKALLDNASPYRFRPEHARNTEEARAKLAEQDWDVVVIDWVLQSDSMETAESFLESLLPRSADTSLVVLSGHDPEYLSEKAIRTIGRRAVSWCSKRNLDTARLVQAMMTQRNRLISSPLNAAS